MRGAMREFLAGTRAFLLAITVHIIMAALVVLGTMDWKPFRPPVLTGLTIEAVMVDTAAIKQRREQAKREAAQAVQRKAEQDRREKELKARNERLEREKHEAEAAEKKRLKKQAAKKREEDMRLQRMREKQAQDKKDREKKRKDELEQVRNQREKAARDAKIEEERLKQIDARRQAEADAQRQAKAVADMQKQMAAEASAGEIATLAQRYALEIQAQVTNNWLRPPTARSGLRCTLRIVQIPGGEVISATIAGTCNGDEATRRSLVAAVERAGSLPYRGFEKVFQREIDFNFSYDGD
jgi:colicin import membrane protein